MQTPIDLQTPTSRIEQLEAQLRLAQERAVVAQERAVVAEEQLRRVHVAVRAFKKKQLESRAAQVKSQIRDADARAPQQSDRTGLYSSWAVSDPSLDERLDEYLSNEFEPDRSRDWMLRQ